MPRSSKSIQGCEHRKRVPITSYLDYWCRDQQNSIPSDASLPIPTPLWTFQTAQILQKANQERARLMTDRTVAGTGTGSASIASSSSAKGGRNRLGVVKKVTAAVTEQTMDEPLSLCQYRLRRTPTHAHEYGQDDSSQTTHPQRHPPRPRALEICQPRFNHTFSS
jgi:hypothetical protein